MMILAVTKVTGEVLDAWSQVGSHQPYAAWLSKSRVNLQANASTWLTFWGFCVLRYTVPMTSGWWDSSEIPYLGSQGLLEHPSLGPRVWCNEVDFHGSACPGRRSLREASAVPTSSLQLGRWRWWWGSLVRVRVYPCSVMGASHTSLFLTWGLVSGGKWALETSSGWRVSHKFPSFVNIFDEWLRISSAPIPTPPRLFSLTSIWPLRLLCPCVSELLMGREI